MKQLNTFYLSAKTSLLSLLTLALISGCGSNSPTGSGGSNSGAISGIAVPFVGLVASYQTDLNNKFPFLKLLSLEANQATAAGCGTVTASLYRVDSAGNKSSTALASAVLTSSQARYAFNDVAALGVNLGNSSIVQYVVDVAGCSNSYSRPVTAYPDQDVTANSTLVAYLLNTFASDSVVRPSKETVASFLSELPSSGSSVSGVYATVTGSPTLTNKFNNVFGVAPTILTNAAPQPIAINAPTSIAEGVATLYSASVTHWHPAYTAAYLWKKDGVAVSTTANYSYTPGSNDQGLHTMELFYGRDDGAGNVDFTKPYKQFSYAVTVQDTITSIAPNFALQTPASSPVNTRNLTLSLDTGAALANCSSFVSLAITENTLVQPTNPGDFTLTCTTAPSQNFNYTLVSAGDGTKTLRLWARDGSGNVASVPTSLNVVLDTAAPSASITNLAASVLGGSTQTISYTTSDVGAGLASVTLQYAQDGVTFATIASVSTASSSYNWSVPSHNTALAKIKVIATDSAGNSTSATTAAFTIDSTGPTVALTSLTGANKIKSSSATNITWTASDGGAGLAATPISLYYSNNGGTTWSSIATGLAHTGTYSWTPSQVDGATYRVKVTAADSVGNTASDNSASNFTIDDTAPTVTLTSLTGGQYIKPGSATNITYTATDALAGLATNPITYQYSSDGGSTYTNIATAQAYTGTYAWTPGLGDGSNYRVRVQANDGAGNVGQSASGTSFVIDGTAPTINITNLPAIVAGDSTQTIQWTVTEANASSAQTFTVEFYDGSSWSTLTNTMAAGTNGPWVAQAFSYSWSVGTSVNTGSAKIRVTFTDLAGNQTQQQSNTFAVRPGAMRFAKGAVGYQQCAILYNGKVKCWGSNSYGQLGYEKSSFTGKTPNTMGDYLPAVNLGTGRTAKTLKKGGSSNQNFCAILDNDQLKCWGYNGHGELGYGDNINRGYKVGDMGDSLPYVNLGTGRTVKKVTGGYTHNCAILDNNTVKCWGYNHVGQLGYGDTTTRGWVGGQMGDSLPVVDLGTGRTAVDIAAGAYHTCAILDNGTVKCWGYNPYGGLGVGDTTTRGNVANQMGDNLPVADMGTGRTAVAIDSGYYHNCAILDNGQVKCWGYAAYGNLGYENTNHLGDGAGEMGNSLAYVNLGTGRTATKIAVGIYHSCAILDNGSAKCWGFNANSSLGVGDMVDRGKTASSMGDSLPAIALGTGRTATDITAGAYHTCVRLDNNTLKCWGYNVQGQLGILSTNDYWGYVAGHMGDSLPVVNLGTGRTVSATAVQSMSAGIYYTCALLDNAQVKCFGQSQFGENGTERKSYIGDFTGDMGANLAYVNLGTGRTATRLAHGEFHTCAVLDNGKVKCWGYNLHGQLGYGDTNFRGDLANTMGDNLGYVDLGTGRTAVDVTAGHYFTCALLDNATAKCWGHNGYGQLGYEHANNLGDQANEMGDNLPAINVGTGRTVTKLLAAGHHVCALLDNAKIKCWGYNVYGELGQGDTSNRGGAANQMGDNLAYIDVGTGRTVLDFDTGIYHVCARLDNNNLKCWGYAGYGELGYEDTVNRGSAGGQMGDSLPNVNLGTGRTVTQLVSGGYHNCALLDNGTTKCWGFGYYGSHGLEHSNNIGSAASQMGNSLPAINVGTGRTILSLSTAGTTTFNTCAVLDNYTVKCWGSTGQGENGNENINRVGSYASSMGDFLPVTNLY